MLTFPYQYHVTCHAAAIVHTMGYIGSAGGFYNLENAKLFASVLNDGLNYVSIFDANEKRVLTLEKPIKG